MGAVEELRYRDFLDIALGGTILGTGGGGSYTSARSLADRVLRRKKVRLISPEDVPSGAAAVGSAAMGSPDAMQKRPLSTETRSALTALEDCVGRKFGYILPIETSGYNMLASMTTALDRNLAVIDADGAGRSIPRLGQTLLHAHGVPFAPFALADDTGRSIAVASADFALEERIALNTLEYFGWLAGLACFPMSGKQVRDSAVPGTISLARKVGAAVRDASTSGADILHTVLEVTGGTELVRGTVTGIHNETDGSYTFGTVRVRGVGHHGGTVVSVKSMNENMVAFRDGGLAAVAPDRICYIRPDGRPVTNADVSLGESIEVFVIEAQREWKTSAAIGLFSETLKAMGYDGSYVPARIPRRGRKN
ncbi:MAG: DUF917 domain-containing protein [Thermoplasmata archaeon]